MKSRKHIIPRVSDETFYCSKILDQNHNEIKRNYMLLFSLNRREAQSGSRLKKASMRLRNVWTELWGCKRARTVEHFRADFRDASEAQFGSDCSARLGHFYRCIPSKSNHILERVGPILLLQSGSGQNIKSISASFWVSFWRSLSLGSGSDVLISDSAKITAEFKDPLVHDCNYSSIVILCPNNS